MRQSVLFLIDTLEVGGTEKSLLEIISRFRKYKPIVCYIYKGSTLRRDYESLGIQVVSLNIEKKLGYSEALLKLDMLIKRLNISIIHSSLFRSDMISRKLKKRLHITTINSIVSNSYSAYRFRSLSLLGKIKLMFYMFQDWSTAKQVDLFISNSETAKMTFSNLFSVQPNKVKVIHRGRDIRRFISNPAYGTSAESILDGKGSKPMLISVGRLVQSKGFKDLIQAVYLLKCQGIFCDLYIAGDGPFRSNLEDHISSLGLLDCVHLLGSRNDVHSLLNMADIFVFPSYYEGLPGALIEAMLAGKIIITTGISENRECVSPQSALFYRPGDYQSLMSQIKLVIENPESFAFLGKNARSEAVDKFNIDEIAEKYELVYDELLEMR